MYILLKSVLNGSIGVSLDYLFLKKLGLLNFVFFNIGDD